MALARLAKIHLTLAASCAAAELAVSLHLGFRTEALWAVPALLLFYFLAYEFDVKVPGLGSINVDQAIAFPAAALLGNPALAGILAGLGMAGSRLFRMGLAGFRPINAFDSAQTALSVSLGTWYFLAAAHRAGPQSGFWYLHLVLGMAISSAVGWASVLAGHAAAGRPVPRSTLRKSLPQSLLWILLSSPFVALVVGAIEDGRPLLILLSGAPILVVIWTLRLNARLEERNAALVQAGRKQEFLQGLSAGSAISLEDRAQLKDLLAGLKTFVPWDGAAFLVLPMARQEEPEIVGLGHPAARQEDLVPRLAPVIEEAALNRPIVRQGAIEEPFFVEGAQSQVLVAVATPEVAFGLLAAERGPGASPFTEDEVLFLQLALSEVAHLVQEGVLRGHLLATNQKLVQQADYLRQILHISDLLKVHLDVQGILDRVAVGIRQSLGFQTVLISLFHEEEGHFERMAQAGMGDRWQEIRAVRPPAKEILELLQEKYRIGNCYFISHSEAVPSPYDVMPLNPKSPKGPEDWDPMDMLLIPLKDKDERLLGVISVDEPLDGKIPSDESLRALEILANQTVHALESAHVHAQIKRQATLDGLTGLSNHAHFQRILASQAQALAEAGTPYSVLMMDLDNFKQVNDSYGHLAGDAVLRAVANALASSIRREDVAARYGGEEFAVLLPHLRLEQARPIAERIRLAVEELRVLAEGGGRPIRVTLSTGVAACPENGADHQRVLEQADAALYRAKKEGKNRVCRVS